MSAPAPSHGSFKTRLQTYIVSGKNETKIFSVSAIKLGAIFGEIWYTTL